MHSAVFSRGRDLAAVLVVKRASPDPRVCRPSG